MGKVTEPAEYSIRVHLEDDSGGMKDKTLSLRFQHMQTRVLELLSTELATGVIDVPYHFDLAVGGGVGQVIVNIKGTLPKGMTVEGGTITGTPQSLGSWPLEISISDDMGQRTEPRLLTLKVVSGDPTEPHITTDQLPLGTVNKPYKAVLAAEGGLGSYQWHLQGKLPPGLIQKDSSIVGTLDMNSFGEWPLKLSVRDQAGQISPPQSLILKVDNDWPDVELVTKSLPPAYTLTHYMAPLIAEGCWIRCTWKAIGLPPGLSLTGGVLHGLPEQMGQYTIKITLIDERKHKRTRSLKLDVRMASCEYCKLP
jgi:hypothetical protein